MDYIRTCYGVPAKRGGRVIYHGDPDGTSKKGTITGSRGSYLRIRLDGQTYSFDFHPTWKIEYLPEKHTCRSAAKKHS